VILFLRFVGLINAAVWLGASIFFTFVAGPAFFSPEMQKLLTQAYAGAAAEIVIQRYFILHYCCGAIALAHIVAEWLLTGRPIDRLTAFIAMCAVVLSLIGGLWLQPQLRSLHRARYWGQGPEEREIAARTFRTWHGAAQVANLAMLGGLTVFFWRLTRPDPLAPRFDVRNKFTS
jgi:hypothetical protein